MTLILNSKATAYQVVDVNRGASSEAIKTSYTKLILLWHPDKTPHREANDVTQKLHEACHTLRDASRRRAYDIAVGYDQDAGNVVNGASGNIGEVLRRGVYGRIYEAVSKLLGDLLSQHARN